jgi:hypothetical protein
MIKIGPWEIEQAYLIRTCTHYYSGRLVEVFDQELVLDDAAWITDTGRYFDCLKKGTLNEIEPIPGRVIIGRGAIVEAAIWPHKLPDKQK